LKNRIYASHWEDYELIDAGNGLKLERWGKFITIRPDVNAYFQPQLSKQEWERKAHFVFKEEKGVFGTWINKGNLPLNWDIEFEGVRLSIFLKNTKHTGVFPEQNLNWKTIKEFVKSEDSFLNLFGYTGASSMMALANQASVFHVDSSKSALTWTKENARLNKFDGCKLVLEDVVLFMEREIKRKHQYELIQMDPPAWGIGTKGKKWQLENHIDVLMSLAAQLLKPKGQLIVSTYSAKITPLTLKETAEIYFPNRMFKTGMLATKSTTGKALDHGSLLHIF
jgi:23S rRNA (cytosine1962-C5)-methyltransferase